MQRKQANNILQFKRNTEKIPSSIKKFYNKSKDYEGGISLIAEKGSIIPRVVRDAKVDCKAMWASEIYLDENGRSRIDVAFQLCIGVVDGVIRIEAGEELIPIYDYLNVTNVVTGVKYFKSMEVFLGALDQVQSSVIKSHLGDANTPYFPGLAYFVLKGFKLWKWANKAVPVLRAVVLRNIVEYTQDEYEEKLFPGFVGTLLSSITGLGNKIYGTANTQHVYELDLISGVYTSLGTSGSTNHNLGEALAIMDNSKLYVGNGLGLYEWVSGTTWTQIKALSGVDSLRTNVDKNLLLFSDNTQLWVYNKSTSTQLASNVTNFESTNIISQVYNLSESQIYVLTRDSSPSAAEIWRGNSDGTGWTKRLRSTIASGSGILTIIIDSDGILWFTCNNSSDGGKPYLYRFDDTTQVLTPYKIADSPVNQSHIGLCIFAGKIHVTFAGSGTTDLGVRRFEDDNTFTTLTIPVIVGLTDMYEIIRHNNRLYVSNTKGVFQQG